MSHTTHRNRHDRLRSHFGDLPATLVELQETIDDIESGTTLQEALGEVEIRLQGLEARGKVIGHVSIDAIVA